MYADITIKRPLSTLIFDALGMGLIYLIPTLSHVVSVPFYFLDPMRIIVILAACHTVPLNAYFLAITLPLMSFVISGHPVLLKSTLIMIELFLNVGLFVFLRKRGMNLLFVALVSILFSKVVYYGLKSIVISTGLLFTELISTPIIYQVLLILVLSIYMFTIDNYLDRKKNRIYIRNSDGAGPG